MTWAARSGVQGESCGCEEISATAYGRVEWDAVDEQWEVTCTSGCDFYGGPIKQFLVVESDTCFSAGAVLHSDKYCLAVIFEQHREICGNTEVFPKQVEWTTTAVDDGDRLAFSGYYCTESYAVSPESQSWTVTDTGTYTRGGGYPLTFPCWGGGDPDCETGVSITIEYQ